MSEFKSGFVSIIGRTNVGKSTLLNNLIKEDVSITFAVALRNTNAALVLAIGFLPEIAALPIIFSIVIQQTLAAIMGKVIFKEN